MELEGLMAPAGDKRRKFPFLDWWWLVGGTVDLKRSCKVGGLWYLEDYTTLTRAYAPQTWLGL